MGNINALNFGAICEHNWKNNVLPELNGYEPKYTFYSDFSVAEFCQLKLGEKKAIEKTYKEVLKSWGDNYKAMTEVVLVINHKSWAYNSENGDASLLGIDDATMVSISVLYSNLYYEAANEYSKRFKDDKEAMRYYFEILD